MSDPRDLLERKAARFPRTDEPWEKVQRRLNRRQRNRRIGSGALALIIAATGAVGAYRAFGPDSVQIGTSEGFHALWPERSIDDAQATQDRANEGQEIWRLDVDRVARQFATSVLGLASADPVECPGDLICGPRHPESDRQVRHVPTGNPAEYVGISLERLVRRGEGGIWSVTRVAGDTISLMLDPGQNIVVPADLTAITNLPEGTADVFYQYQWGECAPSGGIANVVSVATGGEVAPQQIPVRVDEW